MRFYDSDLMAEHESLKARIAELEAARDALEERLTQSQKLYDLTLGNELRWMRLHTELEAENAQFRKALADASHDEHCMYIHTLRQSLASKPRTPVSDCDCWKSRIPEAK